MKTCSNCKILKESSEFNKNKHHKDGLQKNCRSCTTLLSREYYKINNERQKKQIEISRKKRIDIIKEKIKIEKNKCRDCGNNDWRVLDFDHLPGSKKISDIATMVGTGKGWETIKEEIDKCEVVCANCHRIRTYERRENSLIG